MTYGLPEACFACGGTGYIETFDIGVFRVCFRCKGFGRLPEGWALGLYYEATIDPSDVSGNYPEV